MKSRKGFLGPIVQKSHKFVKSTGYLVIVNSYSDCYEN